MSLRRATGCDNWWVGAREFVTLEGDHRGAGAWHLFGEIQAELVRSVRTFLGGGGPWVRGRRLPVVTPSETADDMLGLSDVRAESKARVGSEKESRSPVCKSWPKLFEGGKKKEYLSSWAGGGCVEHQLGSL